MHPAWKNGFYPSLWVLLSQVSSPVSAGIYKWIDTEGDIHLSDERSASSNAAERDIEKSRQAKQHYQSLGGGGVPLILVGNKSRTQKPGGFAIARCNAAYRQVKALFLQTLSSKNDPDQLPV